MMGKPRIAISVELLDAFEAILDIVVKDEANPIAPKKEVNTNVPIFWTGFPKTMEYKTTPTAIKNSISRVLYIIFARIISTGLQSV